MALTELRSKDLERLRRLDMQVRRAPTWDDVGLILATGLRELIPSEYCIYNETDPSGTQFTAQHITEHIESHHELLPRFYHHLDEHPIVANLGFEGLFFEVSQIADFCTLREYQQSGLYKEFYRYIGVDHQILAGLGIFGGVPVICCTHRKRKAFTTREQQIMEAFKLYMIPLLNLKAAEQRARLKVETVIGCVANGTGLAGLDRLTVAELRVMGHLLRGDTYRKIATALDRSPRTVEKHVAAILRKLYLENRWQLDAAFRQLSKHT